MDGITDGDNEGVNDGSLVGCNDDGSWDGDFVSPSLGSNLFVGFGVSLNVGFDDGRVDDGGTISSIICGRKVGFCVIFPGFNTGIDVGIEVTCLGVVGLGVDIDAVGFRVGFWLGLGAAAGPSTLLDVDVAVVGTLTSLSPIVGM